MTSFLSITDCQIEAFEAVISRELNLRDGSPVTEILHQIPIYDASELTTQLENPQSRQALLEEWADILVRQSGVLVLKQAIANIDMLDRVTGIYESIIQEEQAKGVSGDHFAGAGANDRVWNALQKLAFADPVSFIRYFSSPSIDAVCEAYLGPAYQMTAQVNLVRPGGRAQTAHRDYHLGFMSAEQAGRFPAHAHQISASITLQAAIAHCDMPLQSGPTKLLPFSQLYKPGYLAVHQPAFQELFESRFVQLPLNKGDAIFFSPAIFHAAGDNDSVDIQRMANLMQISSAMGRPIEAVNRSMILKALYPAFQSCGLPRLERDAAIHAAAEGYAFPTNLDTDPPMGGMASESQADLLKRALDSSMSDVEFYAALSAQDKKRNAFGE